MAIRLGGMTFRPRRLMTRATSRWAALGSGGMREAWMNMRGPMGAAAFKGAAIGAGLNAGASMISDATNGDFNGRSVGRAIGAGIRGAVPGALAGAGFHAGNFLLGRSPAVAARAARMTASRPGRMGMTGMTGGMGGGINMMGRRGMGSRMRSWGRRNMPTFGRMGMTAANFGRDLGVMGRDATRNRMF